MRPDAPLQILLSGHYDTVYGPEHPFQRCSWLDDRTLCGPGTGDMKGGLVVMLEAVRLFEAAPEAASLGWEAIILPNEEIGWRRRAPL
jgi:glutamate carboxypeptidase